MSLNTIGANQSRPRLIVTSADERCSVKWRQASGSTPLIVIQPGSLSEERLGCWSTKRAPAVSEEAGAAISGRLDLWDAADH